MMNNSNKRREGGGSLRQELEKALCECGVWAEIWGEGEVTQSHSAGKSGQDGSAGKGGQDGTDPQKGWTALSVAREWTGRMRCWNEHGDTSDAVGLGGPPARAWISLSVWYEKPLDGLKLRNSKIHYMFKRWPWLLCGNGMAMKATVGAGTWIRKLSQGPRQGMWPLGSVAAGRWSELTERILKTNPTTLSLSLDVGMGRCRGTKKDCQDFDLKSG